MSPSVAEQVKMGIYDFFDQELNARNVYLGESSASFDKDRKAVDTIIIHHTSQPPGMSPSRLSAIELIRLYAPYFANPDSQDDPALRGQAIYSGHIRNGQQVFWPYHWIIRGDGHAERLLRDDEIGWHAGVWEVNCRSIGIVLDKGYEHSNPSELELREIARTIIEHYGWVSISRILGHREVNPKTICPSELFLKANGGGWKSELLSIVARMRGN